MSITIDVDSALSQPSLDLEKDPVKPGLDDADVPTLNESQQSFIASTSLTFHNLRYSINISKTEQREILHGISGRFGGNGRGELVAIMGQSGAGKTTMLNVLAQRSQGDPSGSILLAGKEISRNALRSQLGYVHQDDHHFPELTVFETLMFTAGLSMRDTPDEERAKRVEHVLQLLGLSKTRDTQVGVPSGVAGESRGISGGERKRLSIAEVMLHKPSIIFLDEYTSGLDSPTALRITELLCRLRNAGHTIVATIHQPSSDIFFLYDKLCLLSMGKIIYFGSPRQSVAHFDRLLPKDPCPTYSNPAEHLAKITHLSDQTRVEDLERLIAAADSLPSYKSLLQEIEVEAKTAQPKPRRRSKEDRELAKERSPSLLSQYSWLMWRNWRLLTRNKLKTRVKVMVTIILAVLLGVIYFQLPHTSTGLQDRSFFLLNTAMLVGVRVSIETIRFFQVEKQVVLRQAEQGMITAAPYVTSRILTEIPSFILLPLIFIVIAYPLVGFQMSASNFFIHWASLFLINLNAYGYGLLMGSLIMSDDILAVVAPLIIFPIMLFSGLTAVNVPPGLSWIEYLIYLRYGILAMFRSEIEDQTFYSSCTYQEYTDNSTKCSIRTGKEVVGEYGMDLVTRGEALAIMVGLFSIMWIGAYIGLRRVFGKRQA